MAAELAVVLRFLDRHPGLSDILQDENTFVRDVARQLQQWGRLTDGQVAALYRYGGTRAETAAARLNFLADHPGLADALTVPNPFVQSCADYLRHKGRLTDPQLAAVMATAGKRRARETPKQRLQRHIAQNHTPPKGMYSSMSMAKLTEWHTTEHPDCLDQPEGMNQ